MLRDRRDPRDRGGGRASDEPSAPSLGTEDETGIAISAGALKTLDLYPPKLLLLAVCTLFASFLLRDLERLSVSTSMRFEVEGLGFC